MTEGEADMEAKKQYKSFRYRNDLVWRSGRRGAMSSLGKPELEVGSPPEFRGEPGVWTPEDMVVGALNACLMLTFLALADRKNLGLVSYETSAEGLLENVEGKYRITEVTVQPSVVVKSEVDLDAAREIIGKLEENCFISNSISAKVRIEPQFRVEHGG
jgi:organic hydroperoxide reductase OsmC/OhrA